MRLVVLTKRQYTNKDLVDDKYGRLWEIPRSLSHRGVSVTFVCLSYKKKDQHTNLNRPKIVDGINVLSINAGRFYIFGVVSFLVLAFKVVKKEKPDFIWSCSDSFFCAAGHYIARLYKCLSVVDLYDNFESFALYKFPVVKQLYHRAVRNSDGLSCVSEKLASHVRETYSRTKPIQVITNAVDTDLFRPLDKVESRRQLGLPIDSVIIGTAGDLSHGRGSEIIFDAMKKHPDYFDEIHIAVAGYRSPKTTIPKSNRIDDFGNLPLDQIPSFLSALDLAIVYNRSTLFGKYCFPQKLYEIAACECPLLAANVGEVAYLLSDHPELVYEEDDLESFLQGVRRQLAAKTLVPLSVPKWDRQARLLSGHVAALLKDD